MATTRTQPIFERQITQTMYYIMRKRRSNVPADELLKLARASIIAVVVLMLILPFHYVTSPMMIVPKNEWGFSNTIITQYEVTDAMHTYNIANKQEKEVIIQQAWVQQLMYNDTYNNGGF